MLEFTPRCPCLVGIDSDGCAFDTMELKHKECFIPVTINYWELQGVSKYYREAAEFVNLYSKSRGINRFPALIQSLEWTARRPEVRRRGVKAEVPESLRQWVKGEKTPGNPALAQAVRQTGDAELKRTLAWSEAVNRAVAEMVRGVPPFPYVRQCLQALCGRADVLVVSATPHEALQREWAEHDLARYVVAIGGQEQGTKRELLGMASRYLAQHTLMVGDAPGDYQAAQANQALFFPINPGAEEPSWKRLYEEGIERFLAGSFAGRYQQQLLDEFDRCLPERPSWPVE